MKNEPNKPHIKDVQPGWYRADEVTGIPEKLYKKTSSMKTAGYKTYKPVKLYVYHNSNKTSFVLQMAGAHWRGWKGNDDIISVQCAIENGKLYVIRNNFFVNIWEYFLYRIKKNNINSKQFQHELQEVKQKYPEYFL